MALGRDCGPHLSMVTGSKVEPHSLKAPGRALEKRREMGLGWYLGEGPGWDFGPRSGKRLEIAPW